MRNENWERLAVNYLAKLGDAEYGAFLDGGGKPGCFAPSDYHRELIVFLADGAEYGYKELRTRRGCDSALGF